MQKSLVNRSQLTLFHVKTNVALFDWVSWYMLCGHI